MKDVGACAEYRFASECLHRGFVPLWPSNDSMPYDMVVDTGEKRLRIQVKGTEKDTSTIVFACHMRDKNTVRAYNKADVDFVVLYVFSKNVWYIFPIANVKGNISVTPEDPWCKNLKYKNAWHLLDNSVDKR